IVPLAEIKTAGVIIAVSTASDEDSPSILESIVDGISSRKAGAKDVETRLHALWYSSHVNRRRTMAPKTVGSKQRKPAQTGRRPKVKPWRAPAGKGCLAMVRTVASRFRGV